MNLLFIFTGGTIGSTFDGNYISPDENKPYKLIEAYKSTYGINFEFDTIQPYTELSENNTGKTISALCKCVKDNLQKSYDGIIVTHGTDTLQYTSAALGYSLGNNSVPVCLVSSNNPIENKNSNGLANLHGAVKFIEQCTPKGVWVIYKNPRESIKIHRGTRLIASQSYSDCLYSLYDNFYGEFNNDFKFTPNPNYYESDDEITAFQNIQFNEKCDRILRLESYPGMIFPEINDKIKYIILSTFHSGTINTKSEYIQDFFKTTQNQGINIYLSGVSDGAAYSSTKIYENLGLTPLPTASPIAMYIKLWFCVSSNNDPNEILFKSLGGDILQTTK